VESIEKFVGKILMFRHEFVHELSLEFLSAFNIRGYSKSRMRILKE